MKHLALLCLFLLGMTMPGIAAPVPTETDPALTEEEYLFEVVRHLYRWYLDETDAEKIVGKENVEFWVKAVPVELDPGDESRFGEIVIPALGVKVSVKKANYSIDELDLEVKMDTYKITNVSRASIPSDRAGYDVVTTSYRAMRDYGTRTRTQVRFPDEDLLDRMRAAARQRLRLHMQHQNRPAPTEAQAVHLSPVSPVANEAWIFWEGGRVLIRFASDIDLENPAVWEQEDLHVDTYDIDEQTVVSLDEVAGSNAYLTRDQVGRVLFNCVVLGRRMVLQPRPPTDATERKTGAPGTEGE